MGNGPAERGYPARGVKIERVAAGGYALAVDVERTRAYYRVAAGVECGCAGCRNYARAAAAFPDPVKYFMESLGVAPEKPAEVYVNAAEDEGRMARYGGFYHLCGAIEGEPADGGAHVLAPGCAVWFRKECDLLDEAFPRPAFQMEIDFLVPWVLNEENSY